MSRHPPPRFTPTEPFRPAPGIAGPHAQTLMGVALRPFRSPRLRRERWDTADGDFIDLDIVDALRDAPWVFAFHGLEGSSRSGYITAVLRGAQARGWGAVALNFRSCSGEPNRAVHSYSSGDTTDARFVLERFRERLAGPLFGIGFSLGGNMLVKLMGELGDDCPLSGGCAVSVPYDLHLCARALDTPQTWSTLYRTVFLRSLRRKSLAKALQHPGKLDANAIRGARGIVQFDDAVTARCYGFKDAVEYYTRSSAGAFVPHLRRPTLLVTSTDDPLIPGGAVPQSAAENPFVSLALTSAGGHVGFVSGSLARPRFWAEEQALRFFDRLV
jgi:hypothetical protein